MSFLQNLHSLFGGEKSSDSHNPQKTEVNRLKVLLVEDEPLLADALEIKFSRAGYEVFKAANGQIGLDTAQDKIPNIVILDLLMPVMDGKTMLHQLRAIPEFKDTPVIILTNAGDVDNMRQTKLYDNASAFLIKSNVGPDEIVSAANALV